MERTHLWISKETSSRLYCLRQLKRSRVSLKELILFYCTCIRSLLEYACPVSTVLTWTTIWNVYKDALLGLFTLPCLMLKPLARQDYLHYLKEEKKSPRNSSSRSVQIRNTNYIHFCQKWTYLLTALGTKDYINYQDVGLNVARTVLF